MQNAQQTESTMSLDDKLNNWLTSDEGMKKDKYTIGEIKERALGMKADDSLPHSTLSIGIAMERLGWRKHRFIAPKGGIAYEYTRPSQEFVLSAPFEKHLKHLLTHARQDHGGSRRCAAFLLSLWNGDNFKADLQELLYTDGDTHRAIINVFHHIHATGNQLYTYVTQEQMDPIIEAWGDVFRVKP